MRYSHRTNLAFSILTFGITFLLLLVPFDATFTVWLSSLLGHYTAIRLWDEFLLVGLTIVAFVLYIKDKQLRRQLNRNYLSWLIVAYILIYFIIGAIALLDHQVNHIALGYSLIINLRIVVFFWVCLVAAYYSDFLKIHWSKILLIPATIVSAFGLLQHFVLPADFLKHFGYGPKTIPPYNTVDQNNQFVRLQSTLRGSNPLGAYLVIVITTPVGLLTYRQNIIRKLALILLVIGGFTVLFFTYSRSALLGTLVSVGIFLWLTLKSDFARKLIGGLTIIVIVGGAVAYLTLRNNSSFDDTFLHTSNQTHSSVSSNQNHESALMSGLKDVIHQPQGRGPGTAGPASVYNNHPARIAENYFIQIAQEVGIVGLTIFIAINVLIAISLWRTRSSLLSLVLFSSLIGISLVNMLSHAWADDTLAYIWWGLAGVATSADILNKEHNHHETKAPQKKQTL